MTCYVYCTLNSVFDLTAGKVVGMTRGDYSRAGSIRYSVSLQERLWT